MGWLRVVMGARWFPYVLIGTVSAVSIAFGWGYLKGSHTAEERMQKEMNKALASQLETMQQAHRSDLVALSHRFTREQEVMRSVRNITRPSSVECERIGAEWVRAYDDAVLAAHTDTPRTD